MIFIYSTSFSGGIKDDFFIENKGQIIDQNNLPNISVKYLFHSPGLNVQLRSEGFSYDIYTVRNLNEHSPNATQDEEEKDSSILSFHRVPAV